VEALGRNVDTRSSSRTRAPHSLPGIPHHRPPSAPPPYTYPPIPLNGPGAHTESHQPPSPLHLTTVVHSRLPGPSKSPCRPLPPLPEPRVDTDRLERSDADEPLAQPSLRVSSSSSSSSHKPSSSSPPTGHLPAPASWKQSGLIANPLWIFDHPHSLAPFIYPPVITTSAI